MIGDISKLRIAVAIVSTALMAAAQEPAPKSHQGPHSGVTVRKVPADRSASEVANSETAQAETAMDKKDFATAENLLKQAAGHDPKSYRAWFDFGMLYTATNRIDDAVDAYKKAVDLNPKLYEANFNLGVLLAHSKDPSAETYLRAATQLTPTMGNREDAWYRAWMTLGRLLDTSKPNNAIDAFQHAAALNPKDASPHLYAAQIAEKTGDMATAEKEYTVAQQINPNDSQASAGIANVLIATGRGEQAEQAIRKYIATLPKTGASSERAAAHAELGQVLLKLHRRDEAITEFEEAQTLAPGDVKAARELAWIYLQDKQYSKAEASFRQLQQASPKDPDVLVGLGESLIQLKKFPEAQADLIAALQIKPDMVDAYSDLAFAASENQNYALTVQALNARAKLAQETAGTMFLRATALDHLGDKQNAAASYREFLTLSNGKFPDQEWQARHRLVAIQPKK